MSDNKNQKDAKDRNQVAGREWYEVDLHRKRTWRISSGSRSGN